MRMHQRNPRNLKYKADRVYRVESYVEGNIKVTSKVIKELMKYFSIISS